MAFKHEEYNQWFIWRQSWDPGQDFCKAFRLWNLLQVLITNKFPYSCISLFLYLQVNPIPYMKEVFPQPWNFLRLIITNKHFFRHEIPHFIWNKFISFLTIMFSFLKVNSMTCHYQLTSASLGTITDLYCECNVFEYKVRYIVNGC